MFVSFSFDFIFLDISLLIYTLSIDCFVTGFKSYFFFKFQSLKCRLLKVVYVDNFNIV